MSKLKNYMAETYGDDWAEWYPIVSLYEARLKKAYGKDWMKVLDRSYGHGWRYNISAVLIRIEDDEDGD